MPILRLLQNSAFDPEAIKVLTATFENARRDLGLVDRIDPITETLARKIIEVALTGERDPVRLQQQATLGHVTMTTYQPATPHSDSIVRPSCSACGTGMRLFGIEPVDNATLELLSFECPQCLRIETQIGKAE